eukprot:TRINITY_DN11856_c0_g2_i4.p1 TRINITY_DN11856_c0_g2~~TRINITY_DN11856_c0_g2_i4.p1  ORF type:complete len:404 (-),score=68.70 TRINITY_DN11856_c0_g2_i4:107-1318(-)
MLKHPDTKFVKRNGSQFVLDGRPFYVNGWNSYWLLAQSVDYNTRSRVSSTLKAGAEMGLSVCRTWAFNDGGYNALQISPGKFNEDVFKALDFVIVEAKHYGIRLILSLVNNLEHYGGKGQYVLWARQAGIEVGSSNDSFFYHPQLQGYYKNYVKSILTRKNSISGVEYKEDTAIFAWELMNEPRCLSDVSGQTLKRWTKEMAKYIKQIDRNHLVTIGLEGFYGPTTPEKFKINPGNWAQTLGSDFILCSEVEEIDFASAHAYPDTWLPDKMLNDKFNHFSEWVTSHIEDGDKILKKPVLFTEFGLSSSCKDYEASHRDLLLKTMYQQIYESASRGKAGAGALIWQFTAEGMDEYEDDFSLVPWQRSSTFDLIIKQSCRLQFVCETSSSRRRSLSTECLRLLKN